VEQVTVETPYGRLLGNRTSQGCEFLGLRYAEPPVGGRRFRAPVARRRASGSVDARAPGAAPCQPARPPDKPGGIIGDEDCLNLNVYTPDLAGRRPVLVHAFGGGFETGNASAGFQSGARLAARTGCVVVRINFRIGALGFLHLGDVWGEPYRAGNLGLHDLCAALEWVRENVGALGGDPDNVTLFGLSSGAFMIAALFGVPSSRGLFHRAWLQSGSASRVVGRETAARLAAEFLAGLNVERGDVAALEAVDVARIVEVQQRIVAVDLGERNAPGGRTLGIVDDGETLAEHPLAAIRRGERCDIPILLGTTRDEARAWFARGVTRELPPDELRDEITRFVGPAHADRLFRRYRGSSPAGEPARARERFLGDAIYRVPAARTALAQSAADGRSYVCQFAWPSSVLGARFGSAHGHDEPFVWGVTDPERVAYLGGDPEVPRVADELTDALRQFAASGNPGWPEYRAGALNTRLIGPAERVVRDVDSELLAAWEGVERR
jgi:para-nitrobenzyl esterase